MLGIKLLLVVATLATNARAAFFYCPEYLSGPGGSCPGKESKRAVDTDDEPLSLNIIQRLPKVRNSKPFERAMLNFQLQDDSPPNIELIAGSLRRKYQRTANVDTANLENGNVVKRTNTHSIVTAAMPSQTNSAGVDQDGTDYSYFAEVKLGSSNTPVYMLLDTGAGNTWVMGSSCTTDSCKTHDTFNPSDSKTFKDLAQPFSVSYGSGSVAGSLGQDTLSFAGITLTGATVGIVSNASSQFNSFPFEGILGLSLSKSDGKTFWETLAESKALKSNLVGFAINRNSDGPNTGVVNFGSPDSSRFSGSLSYFPSLPNDSDDWAVQLTDVGFGSTQIGISSIAYIDTGTSFIFAPPADAKKLHAAIDGAKVSSDGSSYSVPCTTTTPLTFSFGSSTYSVSSKDWVSAKVNGVCTSNVYAMGVVDGSSWLVGDTFLKNVYTVFDYDQTRLGKDCQYFVSKISRLTENQGSLQRRPQVLLQRQHRPQLLVGYPRQQSHPQKHPVHLPSLEYLPLPIREQVLMESPQALHLALLLSNPLLLQLPVHPAQRLLALDPQA